MATKDTVSPDTFNINPINIPNIPPWILHKTNIDLSLTHILHSQNPEISKRTALYHLQENYPDFVYMYTDGSKTAEKTGSGVYIQQYNIKLTFEINCRSSVLSAELYAILSALHWLTISSICRAVILTDSLGALQSINTADWRKHGLVNKIVLVNHELLYRGMTVQFMWIPAHQGIPGNSTADFLAKLSTMRSPTHPEVAYNSAVIQLCYSEACSLISHHCLQLWNDEYIHTRRAITYKLFCPVMDTNRTKMHIPATIFRLRAGYCRLHSHLYKISLHPDGLCDTCGIPETVEHFLIQCSNYAEVRHTLQRSIQHLDINFDWITLLKNTRTIPSVIAFLQQTGRAL